MAVLFEAETLPAGTLAAGSLTLVSLAEKVKTAIEETGTEVNLVDSRDARTGMPQARLSFGYHEGSPEHAKIQETLRDAMTQGGVKLFNIEPGGGKAARNRANYAYSGPQRAAAWPLPWMPRTPCWKASCGPRGATVSNEPVQERPGLVVVVNTDKGEQLAGVEQMLSKLPAAAVIIEGPEANEMRQQLTQNFREQGGIAPTPLAEATLPERIQNDVPERLREAGAIVTPAPYAERPELGEGSLTVRYPLDQPEVMGRVSVVLDSVNSRSTQLANDLGQAPDVNTGSVLETPLAQQTRQVVAREQGLEAAAPRELPERQPHRGPYNRPPERGCCRRSPTVQP